MNNIPILVEKRASLWNQAKSLLDNNTRPDGTISNEDAAILINLKRR